MQQPKNQPCQNQNCQNQTYKNTKTGYCRDCYFEIKNQKFNERQKIKCKIEDCETLISEKSKTKVCKHCYNKSRQRPEKNITFICLNPTDNLECLKGILVDKYGFIESIKHSRLCKKCAMIKMVQTRMENGSYKTTEQAKENISKGLKKSYEENDYVVWNKGLDAKTDNRVAMTGKSRPGELNPMFGKSYKDIWKNQYSEDEFNDKINYNSYLKSQSSLKYAEWLILRQENKNAYHDYKREVWNFTIKNPIKTFPNYELRGKAGVKGAYQLDHIISIKFGFEHNINPKFIGSIDNLWFIPWEINIKKSQSNSWLHDFGQYYPSQQNYSNIFHKLHHIMFNIWNFQLPKLKRIENAN